MDDKKYKNYNGCILNLNEAKGFKGNNDYGKALMYVDVNKNQNSEKLLEVGISEKIDLKKINAEKRKV